MGLSCPSPLCICIKREKEKKKYMCDSPPECATPQGTPPPEKELASIAVLVVPLVLCNLLYFHGEISDSVQMHTAARRTATVGSNVSVCGLHLRQFPLLAVFCCFLLIALFFVVYC